METETLRMSPEIAKRVVASARRVRKLAEDAKNSHDGYKYASIDRFYEDLGPILAEEGLFVMMNERHAQTVERRTERGTNLWLDLTFDIWLVAETGDTYGPIVRSQQVRANSSQSYGSCASYLEKYFLRQLLKVPTGEVEQEIDAQPKEPLPKRELPGPPKQEWRPTTSATMIVEAFMMAKTVADLEECGQHNAKVVATEDAENQKYIRSAFAERRRQLRDENHQQAAE